MTFRENINRICKENGTNLTNLVKSLGLSSSKATAINNGSIPNEEQLINFSKALHCSVMDFFYDEEEPESVIEEHKKKDDDLSDILRIYSKLSRRDKHEFMSMVYEFEKRGEGEE